MFTGCIQDIKECGMNPYTRERTNSLVGGAPRSGHSAWRAGTRQVAVDPWKCDPRCAALRGGRH